MEEEVQRRQQQQSNWGLSLPPRISRVLFSKLSISNLPACRLVCKSWNNQVLDYANSSPKIEAVIFSTAEYHRFNNDYLNPKIHCFDISTLNFVASCTIRGSDVQDIKLYNHCNGLLFIEKGNLDIDCEGIFNPMTHEFFQTPVCEFHYALIHGFGFSPATKQYKLFRTGEDIGDSNMNVLRFPDNQWDSVSLPFSVNLQHHGVYKDGTIYYPGKEPGKKRGDENDYIIYALDVETESFEVVARLEVGSHARCAMLRPFNGTIYAIVFMPSEAQLWRMERKDLWVRDFVVPGKFMDTSIDLLKASEDGSIFIRIFNDLFWLNKSSPKNLVKASLISYGRQFQGTCPIEALHFGSLPNILIGHE